MFNKIAKYWPYIISLTILFAIANFGFLLIQSQLPKAQDTQLAQASGSVSVASSSITGQKDTAYQQAAVQSIEDRQDSNEIRVVTREKYRPDGSVESRETEKVTRGGARVTKTTVQASESLKIAQQESTSSTLVNQASASVSASSSVVFSAERDSVGLGPVVWTTPQGIYAGLSYRVVQLPIAGINASVVLGTEVSALPDLNLGAGGFISKTIAPGLEMGVVGMVSLPGLEPQAGVGLSYQF